jgi:hypothetical protein
MGKSYIVSSWRGVTRVQGWPRKRGLPKQNLAFTRLVIFKGVQAIIKWLTPHETDYLRESIARHNRTHRGQRGSAAIRMRDWQTQRLMGRGVAVIVRPGLTLYPAAVARDASFIMDHISDQHGYILQRTAATWEQIPNGTPGQVLTSQGPGNPNHWKNLSS